MMSEDLRRSYLGRAAALEGSLQRLAQEILAHLPPEVRRALRAKINDKIEVLLAQYEQAVFYDPEDAQWAREHHLNDVHDLADQLISTKARLDRMRRHQLRERDDLEMERRELENRHMLDEIDAETGGG